MSQSLSCIFCLLSAVSKSFVSQCLSCIPRALQAMSKSFVSQSLSLSRARSELRDVATLYATLASTSLKHFTDYKMHLQSLSHLTLTLGAPPPIPPDTLLSGNPWSGLGKGRGGGAMFGSVGAQNTFHHFCRFLSPRHSVTHICFLSVAGRLQQKVDGLHSLRIFCRVTPVPLSYKTNKHFIFQRCK